MPSLAASELESPIIAFPNARVGIPHLGIRDGKDAPPPRDSLEHAAAAILEVDLGADNKLLNGAGDQDLIGRCKVGNARANMDRQARHIVAADLDLTDVEPGSNRQVELASTDR
jgi:hypothetical protein